MHGITGINDTMILQGTITTLAKEEATSWYVSEYKKRKGNPWAWASLWDKFPLSKKMVRIVYQTKFPICRASWPHTYSNLVGTRGRTSMEDGYSNCTRKPNRSI